MYLHNFFHQNGCDELLATLLGEEGTALFVLLFGALHVRHEVVGYINEKE